MNTLKKRFPSLSSLGGSDGSTSFLRAARSGNLDKVLEHLKNNIDINTSNTNGLNALHLASKDGHVHVVAELLTRGAKVDSATKKGNTALHIASLAGQEEVVKLLIKHEASVNVQSQNGFTPLYMAAQENHDSVVRQLLGNGANQSLATEDGFTPLAVAMQQGHDKVVAVLLESDTRGKVRLPALHIAAKKDDVKAAALLLENDHNPDVTSKSGFTPLHIASHYGNESIANLLIQKGADVNYSAKHNISPLHVAAKWGKTNMVSLLLQKGANIDSKTRDGLTPLHCAARSGNEQVVDMLLERGAPISAKTKNGLAPLHMAAQGEHVDAARILLYHRAPVDEVTVDYLTALHVAAHCGHVRVAKLLLDRNADANARALNGFTPLHIACKKNRIKVVELLLKHGASISATTESGLTPLHVASFMGCMNIVIYLLQHDASPDVPTVRGETPLHLAARANQTDIIRILLRNGAQVDARARELQTPLHIASRLGNVDIVMLLLQHGAQVDATTKDMYTALHIAAKEGQEEVAAVLLDNQASLDSTTKKGFTPLHLASKYGRLKVAELLLQKNAQVDAEGKNGVTPLHVASHYDHQNVALLLLDRGASPHATAKNGHTPLHIAARKNQMDIATTLLEYGAHTDAESKAGFTPLHLSAQEGHVDISSLLLEHKASPDHQARNGLTPMHLCAQEDNVPVAQLLVKNGSDINCMTKSNYTPLHVACHFGQANMVRFLLQSGADMNATTGIGYTPLHQAAQQGHIHIVNLLIENNADANAVTNNGQTPLNIAQKLGYISVIESLKSVTANAVSPMQTSATDEKYRVVAPESMHETFMSDSEEEGEEAVLSDQPYRYLTADEMKSLGDDSLPIDVTRDERFDTNKMIQSMESNSMPPTAIEDMISPQHIQTLSKSAVDGYIPQDNATFEKSQYGKLHWKNFLVSFMVDARGGAMRGCRHSGVRVIIPPRATAQPTRVTCRYVKPQRTIHPPPLMEGEALASRVLELGPVSAKFIGPIVMELPHFASLRGKEREIVILRSDNGETWREHSIDNSDELIHEIWNDYFEQEDINQKDEIAGGRVCRFITYDFPQYFAVVSRVRQEVHAIGPEGGMVSSTVVPQVQAVFPQGALTKKIKVGLQAQPIDPELTAKLLGRGVAVSPIVTVEPRRRKFHKAITLSMPAPRAHNQGMINQYSGNAPTLRLLCSITGGTTRAQWEDVTGSTPLTFVNDCVSFTTTVSARFWLMDCRNISDATKMATELYKEVIHVPFMAKFVVFAKRIDPLEGKLRIFCMTDDKEDKTLEKQEHFVQVAKSRDVEVLEGKSQYVEMAGNLIPITKSGDQLQLPFKAFKENRIPFSVRVKDQHADTIGRALFMREPKVAKGEPPQQPICILNIVLPEKIIPDYISIAEAGGDNRITSYGIYDKLDKSNYLADLRVVDISNLLGEDWINLAHHLGIEENEIQKIITQNQNSTAQQAQAMLRLFQTSKNNDKFVLEKGLHAIKRGDIITRCGRQHDSYDEPDLMKDSESVEELHGIQDNRRLAYHDKDEKKYSAEEKEVDISEESEDEMLMAKKTVAERRKKIEKKLSVERQIPASTQKREIVNEITSIKRQSLIEDKLALHEEEIMLQKPVDNVFKAAQIPETVKKLKATKIAEVPEKNDFDKELKTKFKASSLSSTDEEHDVKYETDIAEKEHVIKEDIVRIEKQDDSEKTKEDTVHIDESFKLINGSKTKEGIVRIEQFIESERGFSDIKTKTTETDKKSETKSIKISSIPTPDIKHHIEQIDVSKTIIDGSKSKTIESDQQLESKTEKIIIKPEDSTIHAKTIHDTKSVIDSVKKIEQFTEKFDESKKITDEPLIVNAQTTTILTKMETPSEKVDELKKHFDESFLKTETTITKVDQHVEKLGDVIKSVDKPVTITKVEQHVQKLDVVKKSIDEPVKIEKTITKVEQHVQKLDDVKKSADDSVMKTQTTTTVTTTVEKSILPKETDSFDKIATEPLKKTIIEREAFESTTEQRTITKDVVDFAHDIIKDESKPIIVDLEQSRKKRDTENFLAHEIKQASIDLKEDYAVKLATIETTFEPKTELKSTVEQKTEKIEKEQRFETNIEKNQKVEARIETEPEKKIVSEKEHSITIPSEKQKVTEVIKESENITERKIGKENVVETKMTQIESTTKKETEKASKIVIDEIQSKATKENTSTVVEVLTSTEIIQDKSVISKDVEKSTAIIFDQKVIEEKIKEAVKEISTEIKEVPTTPPSSPTDLITKERITAIPEQTYSEDAYKTKAETTDDFIVLDHLKTIPTSIDTKDDLDISGSDKGYEIFDLDLIRNEAESLVDSILEQSVFIANNSSQQLIDDRNDSLSDNFAITSDLSLQDDHITEHEDINLLGDNFIIDDMQCTSTSVTKHSAVKITLNRSSLTSDTLEPTNSEAQIDFEHESTTATIASTTTTTTTTAGKIIKTAVAQDEEEQGTTSGKKD